MENELALKIAKQKARQAVLKALRENKIKHEDDARNIAAPFLQGHPSFEITLAIHPILPKTIKTIISKTSFKHPWFQRKVTRIIYEDIWGRVFNKTTGIVKKSTKLVTLPKKYKLDTWIDELGGMSWCSKDKKHFTCEFRTSIEEFRRSGPSPETFIG